MTGIKEIPTIEVNQRQIMKMIGYSSPGRPPNRIKSVVAEYAENAPDFLDPSYSYIIRDITRVRDHRVYIVGSIVFESEIIARLLSQCERVAIFALTIGKNLENSASSLGEDGWILNATVLDAIGSASVERLADIVQKYVARVAKHDYGLAISRRFSPGYCDWPVQQQKMVFKALGKDTGGVQLTQGCMMIPQKSVSGIIGLGSRGIVDKYNPCGTCEKNKECPSRR